MEDYERIRKDARECPCFGRELGGLSFKRPASCARQGYTEICALRRKCVFASHLQAERWSERRKRRGKGQQPYHASLACEAVNAVRPIFSR